MKRKPGKRLKDECNFPTVKRGGKPVIVWRCFGREEGKDLIQVKGIMKKGQYHSILHDWKKILLSTRQ